MNLAQGVGRKTTPSKTWLAAEGSKQIDGQLFFHTPRSQKPWRLKSLQLLQSVGSKVSFATSVQVHEFNVTGEAFPASGRELDLSKNSSSDEAGQAFGESQPSQVLEQEASTFKVFFSILGVGPTGSITSFPGTCHR